MKIYIVMTHDFEESDIVAVFITKSDADALVKKCEEYDKKKNDCTDEPSNPEGGTVSLSDFNKNHPSAKYGSEYFYPMNSYSVRCHDLHATLLS